MQRRSLRLVIVSTAAGFLGFVVPQALIGNFGLSAVYSTFVGSFGAALVRDGQRDDEVAELTDRYEAEVAGLKRSVDLLNSKLPDTLVARVVEVRDRKGYVQRSGDRKVEQLLAEAEMVKGNTARQVEALAVVENAVIEEIGEVVGSFNTMFEMVKQQQSALPEANAAEVEVQVCEVLQPKAVETEQA
jgi:hypothetical protein